MILQCPSCNARFLVADALIPPAGRNVRCGACHFQWFIQPAGENQPEPAPAPVDFASLAAQAAQEEESAVVPERQLPVVTRRNIRLWPFILTAMALAAAWAFVALVAYAPSWQQAPLIGGVYRLLGLSDTDGLVFNELTMERQSDGSKTQFVLAGSIANHAEGERRLPLVRVQLKDKEGKVIWSRNYPADHVLKPGEVYPFRIIDVETSFANTIDTIVLDLGNKLQMALR
jgi:predicted Zn finger-like uncharacterized protein